MNEPTEIRTYKVMECSTAHITKHDGKLLDARDCTMAVQNTDYGWFVYCSGVRSNRELRDALEYFGFSRAFINLMVAARNQGCKFLDLDCDGWVYDKFPKFDWRAVDDDIV